MVNGYGKETMFWTITASKWSREITWTHSGKCSIHFHPIFPGVVRKTIYPNHIFRGLWVQHDGAAACSSCHSLPGSRDGPASTTYAMASPPCLELLWTQIFAEGVANGCQCCMCDTLVSSGFFPWLWIWAVWSTKKMYSKLILENHFVWV
jgi:hypothetical protein